jgi:hypothetical protein
MTKLWFVVLFCYFYILIFDTSLSYISTQRLVKSDKLKHANFILPNWNTYKLFRNTKKAHRFVMKSISFYL